MLAGQPSADAQETRELVRFHPPSSLEAHMADQFVFWIVVDDLQHNGSIEYDDNRDTVPDRFVASEGLGAFELTISYDPGLLKLSGARAGPLGDAERSFQCFQRSDKAGSISFGCFSSGSGAGPDGDLTLAEFSFEPIAPGDTSLQLEDVDLAGPLADDIDVSVDSVHPVRITGSEPGERPSNSTNPPTGDDPKDDPVVAPPGETTDADTESNDGDDGPGPDGPSSVGSETDPQEGTPGGPSAVLGPEGDSEAGPEGDSEAGPDGGGEAGSDGDGEAAEAAGDGSSTTTVLLWSIAAGGGLAVLGALGLAGVRWRRNRSAWGDHR